MNIYKGVCEEERSAAALFLFLNLSASLAGLKGGCLLATAWDGLFGLRDSNTGLNLTGHHNEGFFDVFAVLSGCLKETYIIVLSKFLTLIGGHLSGLGHVALVADQDARDVVGCVLLDLVHPVLDCTEALAVGDVVSHDDTVSTLVVAGCDGLETFLTSSVPNLKLNGLSIDFNSSYFL